MSNERYGIKMKTYSFECKSCGVIPFQAENDEAAAWRLPVLVEIHEKRKGHKIK